MSAFITAVFLLILSPGPGVLTAAGVGSSFGYRAGSRFIAGLCIGNNLVALAVITGLSAIVLATPLIRTILLWLSASYLCYLAFRIAFNGTRIGFSAAKNAPGIKDGIALQAINPKAYVVNTALFTGFPLIADALAMEIVIKVIVFNIIWLPIHFLWLGFGVSLQRLDLSDKVQFLVNLAMAFALLAVVALALSRQLF